MPHCDPKFSFKDQFFSNILSFLEAQEGFERQGDGVCAVTVIQLFHSILEGGTSDEVRFSVILS